MKWLGSGAKKTIPNTQHRGSCLYLFCHVRRSLSVSCRKTKRQSTWRDSRRWTKLSSTIWEKPRLVRIGDFTKKKKIGNGQRTIQVVVQNKLTLASCWNCRNLPQENRERSICGVCSSTCGCLCTCVRFLWTVSLDSFLQLFATCLFQVELHKQFEDMKYSGEAKISRWEFCRHYCNPINFRMCKTFEL